VTGAWCTAAGRTTGARPRPSTIGALLAALLTNSPSTLLATTLLAATFLAATLLAATLAATALLHVFVGV